ncbi:hypothetical protein OPV22_006831 [Ensete ventricosum]|uniref:Uncharacterized protein n=1 Tax=Ensete ventricosum TaxID=4639 RepID=A0AAV8RFX6_ENSVE|nr:hypothetical protein OPV22_006831 [Ensete ventricosum]
MMLHQFKSQLLHPLLTKRLQLVSKAVKQKTSTEQMGRTVEISSQIDLPRRCMLLLEVVLPLVICLATGVTDAILGCSEQ